MTTYVVLEGRSGQLRFQVDPMKVRRDIRWYLRMGPTETPRVWALVRAYLDWECELGGRASAALL